MKRFGYQWFTNHFFEQSAFVQHSVYRYRANIADKFDAKKSRLIDTWWRKEAPEKKVHQSLRCYTPADIELLLEGTGLRVEMIEPGGKIDYEAMKFVKKVPIEEAMTYYIKLVLK